MQFEEAIKLQSGSSVFDTCGNKLSVCSIDFNIPFTGEKSKSCTIHAVDSKMNKRSYSYEELFQDQEFISDEEKILIEWISNNKKFIVDNYDVIHIISHCFLQGFAKGYEYKKIYTINELLQK
jgi:hypothetical protein